MYLEFTEEQQALQRQLRQYFEDLVADGRGLALGRADLYPLHPPDGSGRLAGSRLARGVRRHGPGAHRSDDLRRGVPLGGRPPPAPHPEQRGADDHGPRAPTSRSSGSCPGFSRGEVHFSIGYTEPSAGTDLASLKTRAVRDGDEYVINGQKIFTSAIQYADYVWLAARTDPDAPKHKGLSVFIVPVDAPGFHWTPLPTIAGDITSSTFYEDVRVPAANLVGAENQGWKLITNQLNHERVAICPASGLLQEPHRSPPMGAGTPARGRAHRDGSRVGPDQPGQGARKGRRAQAVELEGGVGLGQGIESRRCVGHQGVRHRARPRGLSAAARGGRSGGISGRGVAGAVLRGRLENQARSQTIFTFGGGTNEIQRDIVAMIGLGMPRAPR